MSARMPQWMDVEATIDRLLLCQRVKQSNSQTVKEHFVMLVSLLFQEQGVRLLDVTAMLQWFAICPRSFDGSLETHHADQAQWISKAMLT